jgi:hypothetical protein
MRKAAKWKFPQSFLQHFMKDAGLERSTFQSMHDNAVQSENLGKVVAISALSGLREPDLVQRLGRLQNRLVYLKFDRPVSFSVSTVALRKTAHPELREEEFPVVGMARIPEIVDVSMFSVFKLKGTLGKVVNFMHHVEHKLPSKAISRERQKSFAGEVRKRLGRHVEGARGVFINDPGRPGRYHFLIIDFKHRASRESDLMTFGHHQFKSAYEP